MPGRAGQREGPLGVGAAAHAVEHISAEDSIAEVGTGPRKAE